MTVTSVTRVIVHPGRLGEVLDLVPSLVEQAGREPGTLVYVLHRSTEEPSELLFLEVFVDDNARAVHRGSDFMRSVLPTLRPLFSSLEAWHGTVLGAKGI